MIYTNQYLKNIIYNVNALVGAKYLIMNDSFIRKQKKFRKKINTILVTFGGCDPYNVTLKIIESLITIQNKLINKKINILIGDLYPYKRILKDFLSKTPLDYDIYQNVKDITKFYQGHDCAITAGGNTFYELCALGIPCSVVTQNMRQHNACKSLKYDLHMNYIGLYEKLDNSDIGYKINNFVNDEKMREKNFKSCIEFYGTDAKKIIYEKIIGDVNVSN